MSIRRRGLIGGALVGAAAAGLWAWGVRKERPRVDLTANAKSNLNVLLVLSDQERDWSMYPAGFIARCCPARSWLLERGVRFRHAVTPTQFCSMARGVVYSGTHSQTNGVWENVPIPYATDMRRDIPTSGSLFADAGYVTGYAGKWHLSKLGDRDHSLPPEQVAAEIQSYGFMETDETEEVDGALGGLKHDGRTVGHALRFVQRHARDERPWFLAVNLLNPHDIMYYTANDAMTRSRLIDFPDRSVRPPDDPLYSEDLGYEVVGPWGPATLKGRAPAAAEYGRAYDNAMGVLPYDDAKVAREFQNYYWNCTRDSDRHLLTLLRGLERSGEIERTVILFTADHGEYLGAHGLRGKGATACREASHVPFVIVHPDGRKGVEASDPVSLIDIAPTLLSFAGVERETLRAKVPALTGFDVSAPVLGKNASARAAQGVLLHWTGLAFQDHTATQRFKDVLAQEMPWRFFGMLRALAQNDWSKRGQMRALFDGRYKYARYFAPNDPHMAADRQTLLERNDLELFDTQADPGELENLAADPANLELILSLNARLNDLIASEIGVDDGGYLPVFVRL